MVKKETIVFALHGAVKRPTQPAARKIFQPGFEVLPRHARSAQLAPQFLITGFVQSPDKTLQQILKVLEDSDIEATLPDGRRQFGNGFANQSRLAHIARARDQQALAGNNRLSQPAGLLFAIEKDVIWIPRQTTQPLMTAELLVLPAVSFGIDARLSTLRSGPDSKRSLLPQAFETGQRAFIPDGAQCLNNRLLQIRVLSA